MGAVRGRERKAHFVLNVRRTPDVRWEGRVENITTGECSSYESLLELILLLKKWMDQNKTPLPPSHLRSWSSDEGSLEAQVSQLLEFMERINIKEKDVEGGAES